MIAAAFHKMRARWPTAQIFSANGARVDARPPGSGFWGTVICAICNQWLKLLLLEAVHTTPVIRTQSAAHSSCSPDKASVQAVLLLHGANSVRSDSLKYFSAVLILGPAGSLMRQGGGVDGTFG